MGDIAGIRYIPKRRTFLDGDAYVSSETPLGDNSVLVQSPKRVYFRFDARPFRVVLRSSTSVKLSRWSNINKEYVSQRREEREREKEGEKKRERERGMRNRSALSQFACFPLVSPSDSCFIEATHDDVHVNNIRVNGSKSFNSKDIDSAVKIEKSLEFFSS